MSRDGQRFDGVEQQPTSARGVQGSAPSKQGYGSMESPNTELECAKTDYAAHSQNRTLIGGDYSQLQPYFAS
jgi:hypothetical protein